MKEIFILLWTTVITGVNRQVYYDFDLKPQIEQHYEICSSTKALTIALERLPDDAEYLVYSGTEKKVLVTKSFDLIDDSDEIEPLVISAPIGKFKNVILSTRVMSNEDWVPESPIQRRDKRLKK